MPNISIKRHPEWGYYFEKKEEGLANALPTEPTHKFTKPQPNRSGRMPEQPKPSKNLMQIHRMWKDKNMNHQPDERADTGGCDQFWILFSD